MKFNIRVLALSAALFIGVLSCAEQQNPVLSSPQGLHQGNMQLLSTDVLTITDESGQPVANATILVGYEDGNPFPGNTLITDSAGRAGIPADWKAALPVTVQAPGYVTSTIPVALPGELTLQIPKQEGAHEFEIAGQTKGFGRLVQDGKVDFALVMPELTRENILAFDLSTVLSPKNDVLEVIGNDIDLPSNIGIPEQTENYVFPIHMNKPGYRAFVRNPGSYNMQAVHGHFPLQRVVSDIRAGKSIFELINHFTFVESGAKTIDVQGHVSGADIEVNKTQFNSNFSVTAPAFGGDFVMVNMALIEKDNRFVPTDLKRFTPGQTMSVKSLTGAGPQTSLSLLLENPSKFTLDVFAPFSSFAQLMPLASRSSESPKYNFSRLSYVLEPARNANTPQFLPLLDKPTMNNNVLAVSAPTLPTGLTAVATYMVLSEVETVGTGKVTSEKRTRLWEVWSNAWLNQVELPKLTFARRPDRTYRWEVMFLARPSNFIDASGTKSKVDLNTVTHVTRNSLDI